MGLKRGGKKTLIERRRRTHNRMYDEKSRSGVFTTLNISSTSDENSGKHHRKET